MAWSHTNRLFRKIIATATSFSLVFAPTLANAQQAAPSIVIDNRTSPSAPAPSLDRTANGVQQLNIATPNGAGLSHNMFTQYGVEQKGLILNNATKATQTQLGGYVYGNANLHGKAAHVILNEVTGTQASQMLGYTEVAGQKANVVIVNPNGITCNGCGFINTDRVSLATGHPEIDATGKLAALTVSDGLIAFEGKGGDFTAVPVLDILSRRVTLDAKVNAQTARLVAGRSRFDYETGTVHALKTDGSKTPEFAIDSSALGGMYAGQISMLVTEAGAGVRVNGTMAANAGDMTLTTDGHLVLNGSMAAAGTVAIQAGAVQNAGTLHAGEDVRLTSATDITNTGEVAAESGLNVKASTVTNAGTMVAAGQAGAVFGATGNINNTGKVGANKGALALNATSIANTGVLRAQTTLTGTTQSITNRQGQMTSGEGDVLLSAASVLNNTLGQIAAEQGNVTLSTQTFSNESGIIQAAANNTLQAVLYTSDKNSVLTAGQSLKAHVETTLENAGQIGAGQNISILAKTLSNTQTGKIYAQSNDVVAQVQDDLSNAGVIATLAPSANIILSGVTIANDAGQILSSGHLALAAQGISNKAGRLQSSADVTLRVEQFHNVQGIVVGNTIALSGLNASDATEMFDNTSGFFQTSGLLGVAATTLQNAAGTLLSQAGNVQISDYGTHGSLSNFGGDIDAASNLSIKTADYESDTRSQLYAGTSLAVTAQQKLQNSGLIQAGNGLSLSVEGVLSNTGQIAAQGGALTITAGSFVNNGQVGSLGPLDVVALDTVLNDGVFLADSTLLVKANKNIINDKGIISAEASGNISLQAVALSNKFGTIQSAKGIALSLGSLDNSAGALETGSFINSEQSTPDGDAKITIAGANNTDAALTVLNKNGVMQADGNITVNATQVLNQGGLIESVAGQVALSSVPDRSSALAQIDNSAGIIQAQTFVDLATPTLVNQSGKILSLTGDTVIAGSSDLVSPVWLTNESGQIKSGGNLHLIATSWRDDMASVISSVGEMTLSAQQDVSNTGHIVAGQGLTLTAPSLTQATGSVLAAQTGKLSLDLSGTDGLSNNGTIEAVDKDGAVTIVAQAGDITNRGALVAGQNMSLRASGQILNTAQIGSLNGGLSLNATSLVNENEITAPGSVSAELSKVLTNSGLIFSGIDLLASAGQEINNSQTLLQGGTIPKGLGAQNSLILNAPKIENIAGQITSQNDKITLRTQNYVNDNGVLQAGTDVLINTANLSNLNGRIIAVAGNTELNNGQQTGMSVLNNEGGTVQSYLDTDILADTIDNQQGLINAANGVLTISANQDVGATSVDNTNGNLQAASALSLYAESLNNTLGHIIQKNSSGYLTLQKNSQADAVTSFSGQGGVVQAGGDLNIATHSLAGASQVSAGHNLNLVYAGDLQEPVLLQAGADATLKIDGTYKVNVGSGVLAGGASTITAANVINSGALIAQTGNLTLTSGTDIYNTGLLSAGGGLSLFLPGMLSNVQGAILAQSGSLHISAADGSSSGALLNSSGAIEAEGPAGDMVIQAASITNKMTTPIIIKKDQVLWSHDYAGQEQTTVDIPVPVGLLDAATGLQGTGVLHAYLNYNHKKGSSNSIHVEDYGSSITLTSPAPLMAAGHDMRLTTVDGIINDAGHITAGNDITLSGGSLNNVGYDTEHAFYVTCTSFGGCNWESKSVTPVFNGTNTTARKKKKLAGVVTKWKAAPQYREQWGATQNQTAATGSIVAGGNISGIFTGNITNETKKASASAGSFDKFTGPAPQSLSGTAAVAAQGNMSAQQAVQSGPTLASTSTSSQVSGAAQEQNAPALPSYEGVGPAHITVPAGVAVSPISGGVAVPTTVSVIAALPGGSALFVPNPAPDAHYLIETNPAYANLNAFHGSEYLLDRLGSQPQDYIFLGDSAFDTQSVQQQLVSATGKTFMGASYQTPTQQMQQFLDGAVQEAGTLGLRVGESLTAAQQANLTQSIVWYIPETVAGKTVLAPHLYLAPGQATLQDGAVIAGRNVALVGGSLANSGALSADNALTVQATQGDLNNAGGTMTGGSVALSALQGSIVNQDQLSTYLVTGGQAQAVGKVGSITATSGNASLVAARDILFNGGQLSAAKSASLVAGGSAFFDAVQQTASQNIVQRHYQHSASQTGHAVAQIDVGENLGVVALGGDLRTEGAQITAGQNTNLAAQGSLTLGSVTNTQSGYTHSQHHGFLNKTSTTSSFDSSSQQGTTVASAGTLDLSSGKDMAIAGMVAGGKDVTLQAGGNLSEMALKTTASAFYEKKTSGLFFGTSGASQTTGYKKQHDIENRSQTTWTPSSITSAGGNLTLQSTGAVRLDASAVSAAKDLSISGSSVAFKAEQNSVDQSAYHRDKSIGFTARVSPNSVVGQIINTALAATKTSGKGSGALKVMDAMQAGYLAGSAINQARDNAGTLFDTNKAHRSSDNLELAGVQAGVGLASNRRSAVQTESSVQGASALAGGTLSVVARGDSPADGHNGGISAVAAQLAGQNIVLAAQKDITLLAGWDKTHTESRMSSNNAFVGAEASIGTTGAGISVTASVDRQTQHVVSSSATAVDTTLTATQGIAITTLEAVRLNGAEVSAPRIDVSAGSLEITSPQNTYEYKSSATQSGMSISVPVWGAGGDASGSASYTRQNTTDHFASTEQQLSGFYAGRKGLGVDVAGPTTLTAGVLSSTADASLNHFNTGSLSATGVSNVSGWQATQTGFSFSSGAGMGSTAGILGSIGTGLAAGASGMVGAGRAQQERSESVSAISGSIAVHAGSRSGSYTTDVSAADKALVNQFDAQKLSNQLQGQQIGSQLVGEVGGKVSAKLDELGVAGFDETNWKNNFGRIAVETAGNTLVAVVTGGNVGATASGTAASTLAVSITAKPVARMIFDTTGGDKDVSVALSVAVEDAIASFAGAVGGLAASSRSGKPSITELNGAGIASSIAEYNYGGGAAEELIEGFAILGGATLLGHAIISHHAIGKQHDEQNSGSTSQSSSAEAVGADSLPPHDDEPNKGNKDSYSGGPHKDTSKPTGDGLDSHHCPAKSCYKDAPISSEDGPAIKMDPEDHQETSSYGNSKVAQEYRAKQKELVDDGKLMDAIQMDIDDIKKIEIEKNQVGKYDKAIEDMLDYAKSLNPQSFLKK